MMSINRQCDEAVELLAAIQTCVDRQGRPIACRWEDLSAYVQRARELTLGLVIERRNP